MSQLALPLRSEIGSHISPLQISGAGYNSLAQLTAQVERQ
jgi:hypothetical protein